MKIYLLRHAIAEKRNISKFPNDDRPLSKKGRQQMRDISQNLRLICGKIDIIYCSPHKRSIQTAELLNAHTGINNKISVTKELMPEADPEKIFKLISKLKGDSNILLVGHEPFLSNLFFHITGLKRGLLDFKKAGLALIILDRSRTPVLKFIIPPKLLIKLGHK